MSSFNYRLEIDGVVVAGFAEVSGLTAEGSVVDYRAGTDLRTVAKLPSLRKFVSVTLKRGYTRDQTVWQWYRNSVGGNTDRRNVTIALLDEAQQPVRRWHVERAWVMKIEGPVLNATGNEVAIESIELGFEGLTIEP